MSSSALHLIIPTEVYPAVLAAVVSETLNRAPEDIHVARLEGHQVGIVHLVIVAEVTADNLTFEVF